MYFRPERSPGAQPGERSAEMARRPPALRFTVGERVRCRVSQSEWAPGCVVQLWYREPDWPEGQQAPYQVELDDGGLIFAPFDRDELIRAEATFEELRYAEAREDAQASARYREDIAARFTRKHPALYEPAELARFLTPALKEARAWLGLGLELGLGLGLR